MGDVFTILALLHWGPGPALITYSLDILGLHITEVVKKHGRLFREKVLLHRWVFNLACGAISIWTMSWLSRTVDAFFHQGPLNLIIRLTAIALAWFLTNTISLSLAVSFWKSQNFLSVWREGLSLSLLNFSGSAAAAGLVTVFYEWAGSLVFWLCVPIAVVFYQLYSFYGQKYDQAQTHIKQLNKLYLETVEALASAVDAKDRYTHGHARRVQAYASELAKLVGINDRTQLLAIEAGALLHDIGKIAIPEYILNKPTVLTETEFEKMKIHPVVGANMLSSIEFPYPLIPMVRSHHERWDGQGYPEGLTGDQIPLNARILSLVDCYDALTTHRPYRTPMPRTQIVEFFKREAGRSYDPSLVQIFTANLERIEVAGESVLIGKPDVWGIKDAVITEGARRLEKVQPTLAYSNALRTNPHVQRELYSVFEFARADFQCLTSKEIFSFMSSKLENLIRFDAAVFYVADLVNGTIIGEYTAGTVGDKLRGLTLPLEQKLSGWVAANRQPLCNLPPFPDFLKCVEPKPDFLTSAIVPLNRQGEILGAISLYRTTAVKFTEEEFRQLEIIGSQTAILLAKCNRKIQENTLLADELTDLPNGFQLYLIFDQIAADASRYEYPLTLFSIYMDDIKTIRRRWGYLSGDQSIRASANYFAKELRETDFLVRYTNEEFVALCPKMNREQAEALQSRIQNDLDHFVFMVRGDSAIPLPVSLGLAVFPEDGTDLEVLLEVSEFRMREDRELRRAARRPIIRSVNDQY